MGIPWLTAGMTLVPSEMPRRIWTASGLPSAPTSENGPPISVAITGSADLVQCAVEGETVCSSGASSAPERPAKSPAVTKAM